MQNVGFLMTRPIWRISKGQSFKRYIIKDHLWRLIYKICFPYITLPALSIIWENLSFANAKTKGPYQLHGNQAAARRLWLHGYRAADQHLCFLCIERKIPNTCTFKIQNYKRGCTAMSDLVRNQEDRFSCVEAHISLSVGSVLPTGSKHSPTETKKAAWIYT